VLIYATPSDLVTWTGTAAPSNATSLLRSASLLVAEATVNTYYDVDTTGMPTDATIVTAFRDATCCQAAAWAALGINPAAAGVLQPGVASSKKIGTAQIDYSDSAAAADARSAAADSLVPDAYRILFLAGAVSTQVWSWG
jgi:hypothetical protein